MKNDERAPAVVLTDAAARLAAVEALAGHLVRETLGRRCDLHADGDDPGLESDWQDQRGRCSGLAAAVRFEDGFADEVCEKHAENARQRGAVVIEPRRADGTVPALSATAPNAGQREAQERAEVDDWLQRAADDLRTAATSAWGGDSPWMTTGNKVAELAAYWVEEFASDTRADRSPEQP